MKKESHLLLLAAIFARASSRSYERRGIACGDAADTGTLIFLSRTMAGLFRCGHHLAQSDSAKRPTVSVAALNGRMCLRSNGAQCCSAIQSCAGQQEIYMFFGV
jgi:hypothetical protein